MLTVMNESFLSPMEHVGETAPGMQIALLT